MNVDFKRLERNISDMALEGFLKIGFVKDQPVRIYYFPDLLMELLGLTSEEDLEPCLEKFREYTADTTGGITFSRTKERYECFVPARGAAYIYETNDRRGFLKELIDTLSTHKCSIDDILRIFRKESEDIIVEETEGEFQYVIYFSDPEIDDFKYCFTFDEMGCYYHRLTPFDYERL